MYHIKEDKRTYKSSELIYEALITCMKEKEFNKISISDIQRISSVGRSTFYRNFDTIIDVLYWKCDMEYKEVMESYVNKESHDINELEFMLYFFTYWLTHYEILDTLISIRRYDIISQCHYNNSHILYDYFKKFYLAPIPDFKYHMAVRIGAFVGILIAWIENGRKESPEELLAILRADLDTTKGTRIII